MPYERFAARLALVAIGLIMTMTATQAQAPGNPAPLEVVVADARMSEFVDRVEALGTTRANEAVDIASKVTGKIIEIGFDDGQRVKAGDILVRLDSSEEEADLAAAEALLEERNLAYRRSLQLERREFATTAQLDERRAALRQAEAEIKAIRARIEDRIIRAAFEGIVGLRNVSVGALVEPGDLITTLDDISVIKVDFTVPATYLASVVAGLPIITRTSAFDNRTFEGTISSVDSRVDPVTRSVIARAVVPNPDGALRPGLLMTVELLKEPRTAIVVPEGALVPRGRENLVFVIDTAAGNLVQARSVQVGARRPGEVEIRDGLSAGEMVITHGTIRVRPGQAVTVMDRELPPSANGEPPSAAPES